MSHTRRHDGDLHAVSRFHLTAVEIEDGCREIRVEGELDLAVADQFQKMIDGCQVDRILIDLEPCQFLDSTGIALIIHAHRREGRRVAVHSPCRQVLRVLELSGLTANGLVFPDREQALSALGAPPASLSIA